MVKILDCTLRDGGHVNNFEFSDDCVLDTLRTVEKSTVDYIEVGYVMPECIKSSAKKLVVMVDAKNIQPVNKKADFVRVACYPNQVEIAVDAIEKFKEEGFGVFLHLMTADMFENWDYLKSWRNKNILESIYFADTFGSFLPYDVERIFRKIQDCGFENISFHAHNNLQLAFTNTIRAIDLGAYSVDATVFGMGRGGGNLPMELLLKYLNIDNSEYLELIKKYYLDLQSKNYWGYNFESLLSGLKNIHP